MPNADEIIIEVQQIISEFQTSLTLRQIFYQLVSKHIMPNNVSSYKRLSRILVKARHNGDIEWNDMEDRTRRTTGGDIEEKAPEDYFENARYYLENCWEYFELPKWLNQPKYVEVWFEKQALEGIFDSGTSPHQIVQLACKGYSSHDVGFRLAERLRLQEDKEIHLLYFGDWDPSGIDIYRFIQDMAEMFNLDIQFERIAITQDQIATYNIPPMMAKSTDSRFAKFVAEHGTDVVELDALRPDVLVNLIKESVEKHFNFDIYAEVKNQEENAQSEIKRMIESYTE